MKTKKERSSLFVMRPLIFSEALGFSLLSLYVNPTLIGSMGLFFLVALQTQMNHLRKFQLQVIFLGLHRSATGLLWNLIHFAFASNDAVNPAWKGTACSINAISTNGRVKLGDMDQFITSITRIK